MISRCFPKFEFKKIHHLYKLQVLYLINLAPFAFLLFNKIATVEVVLSLPVKTVKGVGPMGDVIATQGNSL